jgi:hypothetical protein
LLGLVRAKFSVANFDLLRTHLPRAFAQAIAAQRIERPAGKKPATHIRDEIDRFLKDIRAAQGRLTTLDPQLAQLLDFELTSRDAGGAMGDGALSAHALTSELADRIATFMDILEQVKPEPKRSGEAVWTSTALGLACLLRDATGRRLTRSYDKAKGVDAYWSLEFFERFTDLVQEHVPEELRSSSWGKAAFSNIWRDALEQANAES